MIKFNEINKMLWSVSSTQSMLAIKNIISSTVNWVETIRSLMWTSDRKKKVLKITYLWINPDIQAYCQTNFSTMASHNSTVHARTFI